ncbi:uncharacterized protein LOC111253883 [Varroa destructor]|uniref:Uncharacterized protein n=2 Tax=Varroa TaxID=62624 RepID=A0A7M7KW45_VARDE|nr:uncharacterized protein LOC111253883 [Varroa destructor]
MQCTTVGSHRCTLDLPKTNRIRTSHTKVVLLIFTVVVTTLLYVKDGSSVTGRSVRSLRKHPMANWNTSTPVGWDDSSITCRVPRFHPLDKGILDYYRPPPSRIVCKEREIKLSEMHLDSGELEILPTASLYSCFIEDVV